MKQSKNNAIQGLRFWAISLIIASHCGFLAQGGLGNNIFFAMSGFFVCQPFSQDDFEYKYFSINEFIIYYMKRIIRIIPVCWLCMFFATWGLAFFDFRDFQTENSLLLNMFFIKSKNHLWFLQQEVMFYFVAPFLILLIGIIKKLLSHILNKELLINIAIFILLNLLVFISYRILPFSGLLLYGNGAASPFMLWLFSIGMAFAYLLKIFKSVSEQISDSVKSVLSWLGSIYVAACLVLSIFTSEQILSKIDSGYSGYLVGWEHPILVTYMASFAILILCLLSDTNIIRKFMGNPVFTLIGNVSFSMYLLHFFLISYFAQLSTYRLIVVVYVISLAMSMAIYKYVEQPLINKTKEYLK